MTNRVSGGSGLGLLGFAVLAVALIVVVAAIAFAMGHQLALAEEALRAIQ